MGRSKKAKKGLPTGKRYVFGDGREAFVRMTLIAVAVDLACEVQGGLAAVADVCDVTRTMVARWRDGVAEPRDKKLRLLAEAAGVDSAWLGVAE